MEPSALNELSRALGRDGVGCVGGLVRYRTETRASSSGFGLYQRVARLLRRAEGRAGSTTVVSGGLHGVRLECMPEEDVPADVSLELAIPLHSARMGQSAEYVTAAVCWEDGGRDWKDEWVARKRMGLRSWAFVAYAIAHMKSVRNPRYLFHILGNKILRWMAAPGLVAALVLGGIHGGVWVQSGIAVLLVLCGLGSVRNAPAPLQSLFFFGLVNGAFVLSLLQWCAGRTAQSWEPRREEA